MLPKMHTGSSGYTPSFVSQHIRVRSSMNPYAFKMPQDRGD
ncbi:hypothetical protein [Bacteroides sp. An322]|nr:hypothetical protein [Bacteroides sp. An322]